MSFRITNGMMINSFVRNMQTNLGKQDKFTNQLSTGRRIVALSDDPTGVYNALTARQRLQRYEQYQRKLVTARNWAEQADTALQEISARITYVKEQLIYATDSATKTPNDRANIGVLVAELRDDMVSTLNATMGDQTIFSGYNTVQEPFTFAYDDEGNVTGVLYNGLDLTDVDDADNMKMIEKEKAQHFSIEVGYNLQMELSVNGIDAVGTGDKNLFKIVGDIIDLMFKESSGEEETNDIHELSKCIDRLSEAHDVIAQQLVTIGATENQIEILEDRYSQDVINYNEIRSLVEDIDSAETIMDWKMAEAVYKQSLSAGARVIQPTLMDFLK